MRSALERVLLQTRLHFFVAHRNLIVSDSRNPMQSINKNLAGQLEIVALEIRDALDKLGEIVGTVTALDILNRIFNEFCVGK